ncbi:MAG: hypothetical protein JWN07_3134 [Hyphomicrobiales bacterium]|nr:hypothetical protein [Hyphomicrobiales bacterium]
MELKSIADLRSIAEITPAVLNLTRAQKIAIWVDALNKDTARVLHPLPEIEWVAPAQRAGLRVEGSPLTVAFNDPALRAAGLVSDKLGDGLAFFEMTEAEAHDTLCSCRYGRTMTAGAASKRIGKLKGGGMFSAMRHWLAQTWNGRPVLG